MDVAVAAAPVVDAPAARAMVLDGRGRDDIAGVVVDGLGEVTDLDVVGSFFTVVEVDVAGPRDKRLEAVVVAADAVGLAAVVVAARVGTEDGAKDDRGPVLGVVADFFTAGWAVPLLRVVLVVPGLACEDVPIRLGRPASDSFAFGGSLVVPGFATVVVFSAEGLLGFEADVSTPFDVPLGKIAFSGILDGVFVAGGFWVEV